MNILLLGSGGREHALAWKLAQSRLLIEHGDRLYAAPGNPGIAEHAELVALDVTDHAAVVRFCGVHGIGLVVVGPEGGLTEEEVAAFVDAGGVCTRLGAEVLRTSTAGVAAVAAVLARTPRWA